MDTLIGLFQLRRHEEDQRKQVERHGSSTVVKVKGTTYAFQTVSEPCDCDVLLGQGKLRKAHKGNSIMELYIEDKLRAYEEATSQFQKTCVVAGVVQRIQEGGGRFLRFDKRLEEYVVAGDNAAHDSVSGRFRVKVESVVRT